MYIWEHYISNLNLLNHIILLFLPSIVVFVKELLKTKNHVHFRKYFWLLKILGGLGVHAHLPKSWDKLYSAKKCVSSTGIFEEMKIRLILRIKQVSRISLLSIVYIRPHQLRTVYFIFLHVLGIIVMLSAYFTPFLSPIYAMAGSYLAQTNIFDHLISWIIFPSPYSPRFYFFGFLHFFYLSRLCQPSNHLFSLSSLPIRLTDSFPFVRIYHALFWRVLSNHPSLH